MNVTLPEADEISVPAAFMFTVNALVMATLLRTETSAAAAVDFKALFAAIVKEGVLTVVVPPLAMAPEASATLDVPALPLVRVSAPPPELVTSALTATLEFVPEV